jgi:DNA-binding NarL/FixJ family response regulator
VLVIDDAPAIRARLAEMLAEIPGIGSVLEAADSHEAVAALEGAVLEAVVVDLHLGSESGVALVALALATHPHALVIVLTNDPGEQYRRECVEMGADFFFDKAREFDRAVEVVRQRVAPQSSS